MLPRRLYEILPYLYLVTAVVSALLIHSRLIFLSSILMSMAGVIILSLRFSSRRGHGRSRSRTAAKGGHAEVHSRRFVQRSAQDRRRAVATRFPLIDSAGNRVEFDRRAGDRRLSAA